MAEKTDTVSLMEDFQELLRYCPVLAVSPEIVESLDRRTIKILSDTAKNNNMNRKERQRVGIAQAKAQGVRFGRPTAKVPDNFSEIIAMYQNGDISATQAVQMSGVSHATFYRYAKKWKEKQG